MNYVEDKERIKRLQEAYERRSKGIYDPKDDEIIKEQQEKIASVGKTVESHGQKIITKEEWENEQQEKANLQAKKSLLERIKESLIKNKDKNIKKR